MTSRPAPEETSELLRRMEGCRLLVVGDLMLDRFLWGKVHRISPEAPVPVVHLGSETSVLGGAGNVARNLRALGAEVDLVGVVGSDRGGDELVELLRNEGLDPGEVVREEGRVTTVKSRVIAHHQQVVRIDRESQNPLRQQSTMEVQERSLRLLKRARGLIVSDYAKGVISPELLGKLLPTAAGAGIPVAVDPKPLHHRHYRPVTVITPNLAEAIAMTGLRGDTQDEVLQIGGALREQLGCEAVLLTRGEEGMVLFLQDSPPQAIPATAREVFDVTGAGDTVIAVMTLALVAGATLSEASVLANRAAGISVGKLGTAVVTRPELEKATRQS